jgi:23S rRNA (pseudouridine1915-N3)-methyltransferase
LPHSVKTGAQGAQDESESIAKRLSPDDWVILLDERGKLFATPDLAGMLDSRLSQGKRVVLVIGGAFGVTDELRARANVVWALSPLVFPHQIVRLVVAEQVYRAQTILRGEPYHHQ